MSMKLNALVIKLVFEIWKFGVWGHGKCKKKKKNDRKKKKIKATKKKNCTDFFNFLSKYFLIFLNNKRKDK